MKKLPLSNPGRLHRINEILRPKTVVQVEQWFNHRYGWLLTNGNRLDKNSKPKLHTVEEIA